MPARRVIYTAAHAGFSGLGLPLGGGAAVADRLAVEWGRSRRWPLTIHGAGPKPASPDTPYERAVSLGPASLTDFSEIQYASFCRQFSRATTAALGSLEGDPPLGVGLVNDIAEGPNFRVLAEMGVPLVTIFHVDVVDYFCRMYLHGTRPEWVTRLYEGLCNIGLESLSPRVLRLALGQQRDCVMGSRALVVPSSGMAAVLRRCYPGLDARKIRVLPWGCWQDDPDPLAVEADRAEIEAEYGPFMRPLALTLSRISPEKGLDSLMSALLWREAQGHRPLTLLVAGEAAYMRGQAVLDRILGMAEGLKRTKVHFIGYAGPVRKAALFALADLYVFPSLHESYGLTLCEALAAGLPAITTDHYSAADLMKGREEWIVPRGDPRALGEAISCMIQTGPSSLRREPSVIRAFSTAADELADIIDEVADEPRLRDES